MNLKMASFEKTITIGRHESVSPGDELMAVVVKETIKVNYAIDFKDDGS